jgi:hypothetical protein
MADHAHALAQRGTELYLATDTAGATRCWREGAAVGDTWAMQYLAIMLINPRQKEDQDVRAGVALMRATGWIQQVDCFKAK